MADGQVAAPGAAFKESHVEVDGFNIRYFEAGTGDAVIYVHGANGPRLSRTHDLLAETYRVIVVELPGFGESPENTTTQSMQEMAHTVCNMAKALGIDSYNVIGNSFGGKVVLWMALEGGEAVKAVVLVGPAAIRGDQPPPPLDDQEAMRGLMFAHPERQPAATPPSPEIAKKQQALAMRLIGPPRDAPFEEKLAGLETPVLALFGTKDKLIPHELARYYAEILPSCRIVMVYDAAHAIDADRPEAMSSVVHDFLERHEQFLVRAESDVIHP